VKKLYEGAHDSHGRQIFPGYLPGAELGGNGWSTWITGPSRGKALLFAFGVGYFSNMVFEKRDWDYRSTNVDELLKAADTKNGAALSATDPNLTAFKAHGGKLILYHGWNDPGISALNTVDYFDSVAARMGESNTASFVRLYMVPGLQHCGGGPGATDFGQFGLGQASDPQHNLILALEQWVESGNAPSVIIARKPAENPTAQGAAMTRPLCPYPQAAKYKGTGDTNDAANFACTATRK
jgi:feruloyl esterase